MTVYFVTQHEYTRRWTRSTAVRRKLPHAIDLMVERIDPGHLQDGDVVMGTLPMHVAAALESRGIPFWALDLLIPAEKAGRELSATEIASLGATLTRYRVSADGQHALHATRQASVVASRPAVTVMLVSNEIMPNYLGYLHNPTPCVLLVASPHMKARAKELELLLNDAPRMPDEIKRHGVENMDYATLDASTRQLLDKLMKSGHEAIVLNATGGTKLMSMALTHAGQDAARAGDAVDVVYVDTGAGHIESIVRAGVPPRPMRAVLDVRTAVLASGKRDEGCVSAAPAFRAWMKRAQLHRYLLNDSDLLPHLNGLVAQMDELQTGKKRSSQGSWRIVQDGEAARLGCFTLLSGDDYPAKTMARKLDGALGRHLHEAGVLRARPIKTDAGMELQFSAPNEIGYLMGTWLEAHVASLIAVADPDDWACGVQVGDKSGRNNELDALIVSGNRTLLIEVKAANLGRRQDQGDGKKSTKAQDAVYKLDSVGHALGRYFSNNWLVSAQPMDEDDKTRARDKRIKVFEPASGKPASPEGEPLAEFVHALEKWIKEGRDLAGRSQDYAARALDLSDDARQKVEARAKSYLPQANALSGPDDDLPPPVPGAPATQESLLALQAAGIGRKAAAQAKQRPRGNHDRSR